MDPERLLAALRTTPIPQAALPGRFSASGPVAVDRFAPCGRDTVDRDRSIATVRQNYLAPPARIIYTVFPTATDAANAFAKLRTAQGGTAESILGEPAACRFIRQPAGIVGGDSGGCLVQVGNAVIDTNALLADPDPVRQLTQAAVSHLQRIMAGLP